MWELRYKSGYIQKYDDVKEAQNDLDFYRKQGQDGFIWRVE